MFRAIVDDLCSPNWTARISAQDSLRQLISASDWVEVLGHVKDLPPSLMVTLGRILESFMDRATPSDLWTLSSEVLDCQSPFVNHPEVYRGILESFLSSGNISYRGKIDCLVRVIDSATESAYPDTILVYLIRALGRMGARRALHHFPNFLNHEKTVVVHESIRSLRLIGDRKAAVYLEKLFASQNTVTAAAAIAVYSELGLGWREWIRLYRMYRLSDNRLKKSILLGLSKSPAYLASWCLQRIYSFEPDFELKRQILKRISQVRSQRAMEHLVTVSVLDPNPRLRNTASWGLQGVPAVRIRRLLKKLLKSKNEKYVRFALLKIGELPDFQAKPLLMPWFRKEGELSPMISQGLVESVGNFASAPWAEQWLLKQVGGNPVISVTAISVLLQSKTPPIAELTRCVDTLSTQGKEFFLSMISDLAHIRQSEELLRFSERSLSSKTSNIRFLACRYLSRLATQSSFEKVWRQALQESNEEREEILSLLSDCLDQHSSAVLWIPREVEKDSAQGEMLSGVLKEVEVGKWTLQHWRSLFRFLGTFPEPSSVRDRFHIFVNSTGNFWTKIFPSLAMGESSEDILSPLLNLAIRNGWIPPQEVCEFMVNGLRLGQYGAPSIIESFLSEAGGQEVMRDYTDYLIERSNLGSVSYSHLSHWIGRLQRQEAA